jgi:hypothetical protein
VVTERITRGRSSILLAAAGAILLALGLVGIALVTHRQLGWVIISLTLCGAGLGLAFTALTASSMHGTGTATTRAGRTVAARDAGLVLGLLILTPVFVDELNKAPGRAVPSVIISLYTAPIPKETRDRLGVELLKAYTGAPKGRLPDLDPAFAAVRPGTSPATRAALSTLHTKIDSTIEHAVTRSFRRPLLYCAGFAGLVLPVLALGMAHFRRRRPSTSTTVSVREPG